MITMTNTRADKAKLSLMAVEKTRVKQAFTSAFTAAGFAFHPPDALIPSHDKSTLFTGSTISTFKPYLLKHAEYALKPMFTVQDCLRTQNNHALQQANSYPKWSSLFCSVGAIGRYQDRFLITQALHDFMTQLELTAPDRLRINISSQDHDLIEMLTAEGLSPYLHFDSHSPAYYRHKFGMDDVTGRNCNLAVSCDGGAFMDIGNLIVIETPQVPLAIEAAFGVETIITRLHGLSSSILALSAAPRFSHFSAEELYIIDALIACVAIMSLDIRPIADNRGRVLRRYLQGLNRLRLNVAMSLDFIVDVAREFEASHYGTQHIYTRIEQYLHQHTQLAGQEHTMPAMNKRISRSLYK
ncbi:hypothetical protein I5T97_08290 [Serratia marcescens]|nr:hypothetical protein [Serratia marcescens]